MIATAERDNIRFIIRFRLFFLAKMYLNKWHEDKKRILKYANEFRKLHMNKLQMDENVCMGREWMG